MTSGPDPTTSTDSLSERKAVEAACTGAASAAVAGINPPATANDAETSKSARSVERPA